MTTQITTASGATFDLMEPHQDSIDIHDIAHALSMQCRFNGHCKRFYSVAQHSVFVSRLLLEEGKCSPVVGMLGLLHDASEAYIGDVVTPLKNQLKELATIEKRIMQTILFKMGYFGQFIQEMCIVKQADLLALMAEARDLMHNSMMQYASEYKGNINGNPVSVDDIPKIAPLEQQKAKLDFMFMYNKLARMK